jgi:seryl-tRNA synthetase
MDLLFVGIPNLLDDIVPEGVDEKVNEIVLSWGDVTAMPAVTKNSWNDDAPFVPKLHDDIATDFGAVKMSGSFRSSIVIGRATGTCPGDVLCRSSRQSA